MGCLRMGEVDTLIQKALKGDKVAISKILTLVENDPNVVNYLPRTLWPEKPRAHLIGVTGSAGVGKSTLIAALIDEIVGDGASVAVIAVDPSSPFSGGAFLGDRVRMVGIKNVDRVFIRSMSTHSEEALPLKALLASEVLDSLGYDYIVIETPGAGQFNVQIVNAVDTVVVVLMPGAGDEIQALKAGVMEIGDVYVVNKADMPEAELTYNQVSFALSNVERDWKPRILKVSALHRIGVRDLYRVIKEHFNFLQKTGIINEKRVRRRELELELIVRYRVMSSLTRLINQDDRAKKIYNELLAGKLNPVVAANELVNLMIKSWRLDTEVK